MLLVVVDPAEIFKRKRKRLAGEKKRCPEGLDRSPTPSGHLTCKSGASITIRLVCRPEAVE